MANIYKSASDLIGGTPLLELGNIEKELGLKARLAAKLEYFNPAGSVKDRIAKAMIEDAEEAGKLKIIGRKDIKNRTGVVSIQTLDVDCADAAFRLDFEYGIETRVGLHCAPNAHKTLGTYPTGTIRFSFGNFNTEDDVDAAIKALTEICG